MARVPIYVEAKDAVGAPVASASVNPKVRSTAANATLYNAESGGSTITNPVTADSLGRALCWVDRGEYNVIVSGTGITTYTIPIDAAPGGDHEIDTTWFAANFIPSILTNTGSGTTPAAPSDGDKFLWIPALATVGPCEFRYRAASASPYKWECTGGAGFTDFQQGGQKSVTSGIFGNWGTGFTGTNNFGEVSTGDLAVFTAPFTGEYDCFGFVDLSTVTATQTSWASGISANGSSSTLGSARWDTSSSTWVASLVNRVRATLSAGDTLDLRGSFTVSGSPFTVARHGCGLHVVPVRVL